MDFEVTLRGFGILFLICWGLGERWKFNDLPGTPLSCFVSETMCFVVVIFENERSTAEGHRNPRGNKLRLLGWVVVNQ